MRRAVPWEKPPLALPDDMYICPITGAWRHFPPSDVIEASNERYRRSMVGRVRALHDARDDLLRTVHKELPAMFVDAPGAAYFWFAVGIIFMLAVLYG